MSDASEAAKKSWRTRHTEDCVRHKIAILWNDDTWDRQKSWFGDDPEGVANFMWGRLRNNYQLYINGREYNWPQNMEHDELIAHVKYCIAFDEDFYSEPNIHFPNYVLTPEP